MNGALYRGSKPVMWSVVEKTALAEAEVEYHDYQSDTIWVKFPVDRRRHRDRNGCGAANRLRLAGVSVVIWTTTPWTIPGNRAISFSSKIDYGFYEVTNAPDGNWAKVGDKFILADKLAADVMKAAKVEPDGYSEVGFSATGRACRASICAIPSAATGYDFDVPLLDGDHVTDDTGTGFVHTAPGHGTDDYKIWMDEPGRRCDSASIDTTIPFTVDADGVLTKDAPGFEGKRVLEGERRQGRRQRRRHQGAGRCRRADRARPPQAPVSAFLALQEAGDLPQHAAVVHRHGQAAQGRPQGRQQDAARARGSTRSRRPSGCRRPARTASAA